MDYQKINENDIIFQEVKNEANEFRKGTKDRNKKN